MGPDCKSIGSCLPRFESLTRHAAGTARDLDKNGPGSIFAASRAVRWCPAVHGWLRPSARIAQGAGTASLLMAQRRWPVAGRVRGSTRSRAWKVVTVTARIWDLALPDEAGHPLHVTGGVEGVAMCRNGRDVIAVIVGNGLARVDVEVAAR
jgi:hypothetical protein